MSKYFKTSDGQEFYTENNAQAHARSLNDKTVTAPFDEVIADEAIAEIVTADEKPNTKK